MPTKPQTPQVRININEDIQKVITIIKKKYNLLSDSEIFKLALSEFYFNMQNNNLDNDLSDLSCGASKLNDLDWTPKDAKNFQKLKPISESKLFQK
jgi:hypothetical protein